MITYKYLCDKYKVDTLKNANLARENLEEAELAGADLGGANLSSCNLQRADLTGANLEGARLYGANLRGASLKEALLARADLKSANLTGANLEGADLTNAILPHFQICPEQGEFIAWKKVRIQKGNSVVLKLLIMGDRTSSLVGRKCRTNKLKVLEAIDSKETKFLSIRNLVLAYELGQIIEEPDYDNDIRVECAPGLHFFMTYAEAKGYELF
jgi:hypothetical protein